MADKLLTAKEVAALLRITTHTVYRLANDGVIPAAKVGALWRFRRADLENYVRAMGSLPLGKQKG